MGKGALDQREADLAALGMHVFGDKALADATQRHANFGRDATSVPRQHARLIAPGEKLGVFRDIRH